MVFSIGKKVDDYFAEQGHETAIRISHYSPQATLQRNQDVVGHEDKFEAFQQTVRHAHVLATAHPVLEGSGMSQAFCDQTLDRLKRRDLTESRKKPLFIYKRAFESLHA